MKSLIERSYNGLVVFEQGVPVGAELLCGMGFDAGPCPATDLPAALLCVQDEGCIAFFGIRFAVLLVEIDGGDDDVGEVVFDFGARGGAVFDDTFGDACGCGMFLVVGSPLLGGVG